MYPAKGENITAAIFVGGRMSSDVRSLLDLIIQRIHESRNRRRQAAERLPQIAEQTPYSS